MKSALMLLHLACLTVPCAADAPGWFVYRQSHVTLVEEATLPGKVFYAYSPERVLIAPKAATGAQQMTLKFEIGGAVSGTTFEVATGGKLHMKGCQLISCALICQPGGEILLEDCTLIEAFITTTKMSSSSTEKPKLRLVGCQLTNAFIESPAQTGFEAKECFFNKGKIEASESDGKNTVASFSRCQFKESVLTSVEVLMASRASEFTDCHCLQSITDQTGSYLENPVLVQLHWTGGTPTTLPESAGKVSFEQTKRDADLAQVTMGMWKHVQMPFRTEKNESLHNVLQFTRAHPAGSPPPSSSPQQQRPEKGVIVTASAVEPGKTFKSRITSVNGLLISQLSSGEEAGQVSKLTLTALPTSPGQATTLKFNQDVGSDMQKALNEVSKFAQLRHNGLPGGHSVELGFADKYIAKDGPSAAVACALLLESAITGKELDSTFAVTGDMNADGSVQPIGGVAAKVRGATKGGCKIVGIPVKNEKAIPDLLLLEGPMPLLQIGIFSVSKFDEALALAEPKRVDALARAIAEIENVRTVLTRLPAPQMIGMLRSPQAQARLQFILQAAPNCLSAKYLLLFAQGRGPRSLSIGGSIEAADGSAIGLIKSIENDVEKNVSTLKGDEVGSSINRLRNLRPKLDPRVWPYVDNVISYGEVIRGSILNPVRSGARYVDLVTKARQSAQAAKAAFEKLTGDSQVREELGL